MRPLLLLLAAGILSAQVSVRFDPRRPDTGPFPSDFLTVPDASQKTGLRVNLPGLDGLLVNTLDGFNVQPRISVRFSGRVNVDTLRAGIFYLALDNLTMDEPGLNRPGDVTLINQVIYDPATDTAYAKPDSALDQHRRYAIVVTNDVKDPHGAPVTSEPGFDWCVGTTPNDYCQTLAAAVAKVPGGASRVRGASVFTTMSATAWLEGARMASLNQNPSASLVPGRSVFQLADIASLTVQYQTGLIPQRFTDFTLPVAMLQGIGKLAFGSFQSPHFLDSGESIPPQPTGTPVSLPAAAEQVYFHAWLPAASKPATGYPVVIFGHGITDNRFQGPSAIASTFASAGIATVAINAYGHGFGPDGKVLVTDRSGNTVELNAGGRAVDLDGDGQYGSSEGCVVVTPLPVGTRDCLRQTVVDLMQLTRAIRGGLDVDGDGTPDFDPTRVYYAGHSLGAIYGTLLMAVEPDIPAAALNSGGGSMMDIARWSPDAAGIGRQLFNFMGSVDNYVLRYQPVKVNDVPGAIEIQNLIERLEWLQAAGDPLSFAPHIQQSTLPGLPIKKVLWQYAKGDRTVPNPMETALVRAANMRESTWYFRNDVARSLLPGLPENPHVYLLNVLTPAAVPVALSAQAQIAGFFSSGAAEIPDANALLRLVGIKPLFEVPAALTEDLNW